MLLFFFCGTNFFLLLMQNFSVNSSVNLPFINPSLSTEKLSSTDHSLLTAAEKHSPAASATRCFTSARTSRSREEIRIFVGREEARTGSVLHTGVQVNMNLSIDPVHSTKQTPSQGSGKSNRSGADGKLGTQAQTFQDTSDGEGVGVGGGRQRKGSALLV